MDDERGAASKHTQISLPLRVSYKACFLTIDYFV